jgi:diguanylate cyclase (GGDEF)-like protein
MPFHGQHWLVTSARPPVAGKGSESGAEPRTTPPARGELQRQKLAELRSSAALHNGDIATALSELTSLAAEVLAVERVSVWHLSAEGQALECIHAFSQSQHAHSRGGMLAASLNPAYFSALTGQRVLAVADARHDPRTRELSETQLLPHGIHARLDVPVFLRGRMVGVLCHEHAHSVRNFEFWEELAAGSFADFVAMVLQVREQLRTEAQLKELRTQVDDLLESRTSSVVRENADLQREVDALQLATETIRKSEDERRRLFAASPVPMLLLRKQDRRVLFANDKCAGALRCTLAELANKPIDSLFVHAADLAAVWATLERAGEDDARELELRTLSGDTFWALLSARTVEFSGESAILWGFTDLTAQKAVEHQLRVLAQRDPLTQAYNRHHFWHIAHTEMARVRRYQRPLSIAMIDADFFKSINDQFGHDVGDCVLRAIVDTCHEGLRTNDVLARYGGEEFVVLLPETPREGAEVVMERLRERIAATPVALDDGRKVHVTVSIGLAALDPKDQDFEALLKRADEALYTAKHNGRNRVELG